MKEFVEKLIGRLEEEKLHYFLTIANTGDEKLDAIYEAVVNAIDTNILIVNQLAEEYNNGWIACSERLPENRDWCLAIFKEGDSDFLLVPRVAGYIGKETSLTTNEGWLIIDLEDEIGINAYYKKLVCIAWQPLPAPYQKGE